MVASIINENEKMKKVIVFGATGNLGAYITIYLKSVGYDVIAVGHRKDDNGFFASRGMKYYSVDITKPEEFEQLPTENIYCVAHFAGELPSRYSFHAYVKGILQRIRFLGAINDFRRIILRREHLYNTFYLLFQRYLPPITHIIHTAFKWG